MRLTTTRQLMLATAIATLGGALWLEPTVLGGDGVAFAIAIALLSVCGFSVGFVLHGFLTDQIIDSCRRISEEHHRLAAATVDDWRRRAATRVAELEAQLRAPPGEAGRDDHERAHAPPPAGGESPCRSASDTTSP